jgi:fused signal recognition particle receptor
MWRRLFGLGPKPEDTAAAAPAANAEREAVQLETATTRSRRGLFGQIAALFAGGDPITDDLWDDLETLLIQADVGVATSTALVRQTRERCRREGIRRAGEARQRLIDEMVGVLEARDPAPAAASPPYVILVVGVNGAGKTTLIAKLAHRLADSGQQVLVAAGDTFRAAATEQLATWAERAGVGFVGRSQGSDPGAVVYDALDAVSARQSDVLIIDTAGRLQAKHNLMRELEKLRNIIRRRIPDAPHEVLLVIDATTGQNGLSQARAFLEAVDVTAIALTKLDGTARGGIALAIVRETGLPIRYIGTGERLGDLALFDARTFVDALFRQEPERGSA